MRFLGRLVAVAAIAAWAAFGIYLFVYHRR